MIGLVFQTIFTLLWIYLFRSSGPTFLVILGGIGGAMLLLAIFGSYLPVHRKQYASAAPVTLLLGIIGIIPGLVITGVLYILAYTQVARARDLATRPPTSSIEMVYVTQPPPSPPPVRTCPYCGTDYALTATECPACGAPA